MRIAQLQETLHGTLSHLLELLSHQQLKMLHIQDMLSIFNLKLRPPQPKLEKVSPEKDSREPLISLSHQLQIHALMLTKLPLMMRIALPPETLLGTQSHLLELVSHQQPKMLHIQDMLSISNMHKTLLNSILDHRLILILHTYQLTMLTQKSKITEL